MIVGGARGGYHAPIIIMNQNESVRLNKHDKYYKDPSCKHLALINYVLERISRWDDQNHSKYNISLINSEVTKRTGWNQEFEKTFTP